MVKVEPLNKAEQIQVGRRYTLTQTYIFGISETKCTLSLINYQKPDLFEFMSDDFALLRHRLTFSRHETDRQKTRVIWEVYSRKRSYLFKYSMGLLCQFYYSQVLREGLFKLQLMVKDSA